MTGTSFRFARVLLVWLAFALRVWHIDSHSLWYDELLELDIAGEPVFEIGPNLVRHAAMPLDYYVLHGWLLLGRHEILARFPAMFFGVLTVPLVFVLARQMFSRGVALIAGTLLAVSFFAVRYSLESRPYALLLFCTTLTVWGLWQAYRTGRSRYWAVVGLALVGASTSHYFAIFLLAPATLFVAWQLLTHFHQRSYWLHTVFWALVCLLILITYMANGRFWQLYSVGERFAREVGQPQVYTLPADQKPNGGSGPPVTWKFLEEEILTPLSTANRFVMLFYVGLLLVAIFSMPWIRPANFAAALLLLLWLVLPVLLIYLFLLQRGTFYAIRYILYVLPAFVVLVAFGFYQMVHFAGRYLPQVSKIAAAGVLLLLTVNQLAAIYSFYNSSPQEDWRAVGDLLQANARPADAVIAIKAEPAINWYYPAGRQPADTFSRSAMLWTTVRQRSRRWFVLSSYSLGVDEALRQWLEREGAVKIAIDRRVAVYFHQEGKTEREQLEEVADFSLPHKELTFRVLAEQFEQVGDFEMSRQLSQKAQSYSHRPASGW